MILQAYMRVHRPKFAANHVPKITTSSYQVELEGISIAGYSRNVLAAYWYFSNSPNILHFSSSFFCFYGFYEIEYEL